MDQYGSMRHSQEDAKEVAEYLKHNDAIVFQYSHDQIGANIFLLAKKFNKLGIMSFGGNPVGRMYVGVYGRGCGHLSMAKGPHHSYIDEKLNLGGEDGEKFAEFYSWIINHLHNA